MVFFFNFNEISNFYMYIFFSAGDSGLSGFAKFFHFFKYFFVFLGSGTIFNNTIYGVLSKGPTECKKQELNAKEAVCKYFLRQKLCNY